MLKQWSLSWMMAAAFVTFALAQGDGTSLDAQIEAIKKAPPQERRVLMNRLKMELANMNRQQRMEAIRRLRTEMQPSMSGHDVSEHGMHPRPQMGAMAEKDQMKETGQMGHREEMGHRRGVDQYLHGHGRGHGHAPFSGGGGAGSGHGNPHPSPMPFGHEMRR